MTTDAKEIVRTGYDALSYLYRKDNEEPPNHKRWASQLVSLLPSLPASILDLGCGCGIPVSRDLSQAGYNVTGIDISSVQIDRARKLVPEGIFIQADVTSQTLGEILQSSSAPMRFAAIIGLYVLIHIPVDEQSAFIQRMAGWLEEGGYCMFTVGVTPWTGEKRGWLGANAEVKMWWSQAGVDDYRQWFTDAGFVIVEDEHVPEDGNEGHQFFLLQKPWKS